MSELPDYEVKQAVPKCVTTPKLEARSCKRCGEPIPDGMRKGTRYCSRGCQNNTARTMGREMKRELHDIAKTIAFTHLHRDQYFSFDGRYEGPLNKAVTLVVTLRKDKGYHPMPIDVHVEGPEPKFTHVTPEDVDWGKRQGRPAQVMPRKFNNFCATCVEMVIDEAQRSVRVTKGVYLPIEHKCNSVRVYNLHGTLLETKKL